MIKFKKQEKLDSCIAACIKYLFQIHGNDLSEDLIYKKLGKTTNQNIIDYLKSNGYKAKLVYMNQKQLFKWLESESNEFGLIDIRIDGQHCNLVSNYKFKESKVLIWEPLEEPVVQKIDFEDLWNKINLPKNVSIIITTINLFQK